MTTSSRNTSPGSRPQLDAEIKRALAERRRREKPILEASLYEFFRQAWRVLEPHTPLVEGWHLQLMCDRLEAVTRGEIKRLVINIPPGMTKSRLVSVVWPVWEWVSRPWLRYMFWSYSKDLATLHSTERRALIESEWFAERWGDRVRLRDDHNLKLEIASTSPPGMMTGTAVGATATGKGGERLVIDDPLNPKQAASAADMAAVTLFWQQTMPTRLRNEHLGAIVLVMQRLAKNDPTDLALDDGYEHLCLPMEYEANHPHVCADDPREQEGELLCPARYSRKAVEALKRSLGTYGTAGQLQQRPSPKGGGIWKTHWWRYYTAETLPGGVDEIIQSWDFSFKKTTDGSYIVGQVWARKGSYKYLLDQVRFRGGFVDAKKAITNMSAKWPAARRKLVEAKANGPAISDDLKGTVPGIVLIEVPQADKGARAEAVSPTIEAGDVFLPAPDLAPWVREFLAETEGFPNAGSDDQVDAASQALAHLDDNAHHGLLGLLGKAVSANRGRMPGR